MDPQEDIFVQPVPSIRPGELGFRYHVPLTALYNKEALTVDVTTFEQAAQIMQVSVFLHQKLAGHEVNAFIFKGWENGPQGYLSAIFHRQPSSAEIITKIDTLSDPSGTEKTWPNVLVHLGLRENPDEPVTVEINGMLVDLPRLFDDTYYLPGGTYSCETLTEVYMSSTNKFPRRLLMTDVPVPKLVKWSERNAEGSLECLHPKLLFTSDDLTGYYRPRWGTEKPPPRLGKTRIIPATNHVTWKKHCDNVRMQTSADGQRILLRRIVLPPRGVPKVFIQ